MSSFVHHFKAIGDFKLLQLQSGNAKFESKLVIFFPCDVKIWQMTLKDNRAPLPCYFKLCVSFHSHLSTQNGVTVRKRQIWVKIGDFLYHVTLEFYRWPWKTIGHLFNATSSFVHHFVSTGEFKLGSPETPNLGQIRRFLEPCDLEIWRMTLKNNRAPLLSYCKLCASCRSHLCIQTGVTVRKRPIWVKFDDFQSRVTLKFGGWPWKTIGHLFYAASSCVHDFIATCEFKLELESGNGLVGCWPLWPWPLAFDLELLHGHHFWPW